MTVERPELRTTSRLVEEFRHFVSNPRDSKEGIGPLTTAELLRGTIPSDADPVALKTIAADLVVLDTIAKKQQEALDATARRHGVPGQDYDPIFASLSLESAGQYGKLREEVMNVAREIYLKG